jgi:hypothetical protein
MNCIWRLFHSVHAWESVFSSSVVVTDGGFVGGKIHRRRVITKKIQ